MAAALALPMALRAQLAAAARTAFPRECCGLIAGTVDGDTARASALHPTANLGQGDDRFEIDPADHIVLLRALRGTRRSIIGCYHSHPNGKAAPSETDRAGAAEDGFIWLIQPLTAAAAGDPVAFAFEDGSFRPLVLHT